MATYYPVIDVETTGLDEDRTDLLEVAVLMLDKDLREVGGYQAVVLYPPERVVYMQEHADPYVVGMHTQNGLWAELPEGEPLVEVDVAVAEFLEKFYTGGQRPAMVGNSNRLDLNFIERHLPLTYEKLHYRSIDLTGVDLSFQAAGRPVPEWDKEQSTHRAMDDCLAAARQFRAQQEALR